MTHPAAAIQTGQGRAARKDLAGEQPRLLPTLQSGEMQRAAWLLQEVVTMGITYEGNYSFAYTEGGEVHTELGEGPAAGSGRGVSGS